MQNRATKLDWAPKNGKEIKPSQVSPEIMNNGIAHKYFLIQFSLQNVKLK